MVDLAVTSLVKAFGPTRAVDGVDFSIPDGALATFLGPSGCGKTTTLRMVAGLETPTAGRITLGGETVYDSASGIAIPAERREIGMVFQSYAIWPHMTVAGNVAFPLGIRKLGREETKNRVIEALKLVRLDHLAERYPAQLSGGQQQRVALARALAPTPALILLARTPRYTAIRLTGAALAGFAATAWIVERLSGDANPVGRAIDLAFAYAPWLVAALTIAAFADTLARRRT